MSAPATVFHEGDVLRYRPDRDVEPMHCREGLAIVADGRAFDTYWGFGGGRRHVLTAPELANARLCFNLRDFREVSEEEWLTHAPDDRGLVTAQHGWQSSYYVRVGAEPDLVTQIENARQAVVEAESAVRSAESTLEWRRKQLAELEEIA